MPFKNNRWESRRLIAFRCKNIYFSLAWLSLWSNHSTSLLIFSLKILLIPLPINFTWPNSQRKSRLFTTHQRGVKWSEERWLEWGVEERGKTRRGDAIRAFAFSLTWSTSFIICQKKMHCYFGWFCRPYKSFNERPCDYTHLKCSLLRAEGR